MMQLLLNAHVQHASIVVNPYVAWTCTLCGNQWTVCTNDASLIAYWTISFLPPFQPGWCPTLLHQWEQFLRHFSGSESPTKFLDVYITHAVKNLDLVFQKDNLSKKQSEVKLKGAPQKSTICFLLRFTNFWGNGWDVLFPGTFLYQVQGPPRAWVWSQQNLQAVSNNEKSDGTWGGFWGKSFMFFYTESRWYVSHVCIGLWCLWGSRKTTLIFFGKGLFQDRKLRGNFWVRREKRMIGLRRDFGGVKQY